MPKSTPAAGFPLRPERFTSTKELHRHFSKEPSHESKTKAAGTVAAPAAG